MRSHRTSLQPGAAVLVAAWLAVAACSSDGPARSESSTPPSVASDAAFPSSASILDTDCHQAPATTAPGHYGGGHIVGCNFAPPVTSTPAPNATHGVLHGHVRDDAGAPVPSLVDVIGPDVAVATAPDGTYGASFPPGQYIVEVVANADVGIQCGRHAVTIRAREATELDFTCTRPHR